jgi:hypothetical protein
MLPRFPVKTQSFLKGTDLKNVLMILLFLLSQEEINAKIQFDEVENPWPDTGTWVLQPIKGRFPVLLTVFRHVFEQQGMEPTSVVSFLEHEPLLLRLNDRVF